MTVNLAKRLDSLLHLLVVTGTLPYYRFFRFNTLAAIERTAYHCSRPEDFPYLLRVISRWRHRKLSELQYISIACAILLGAVIGTFSWNNVDQAYWLARAFWYISLILSMLGILLAAQQVAVLNFLGELPQSSDAPTAQDVVGRYLPLLISGPRPIAGSTEAQKSQKTTSRCRPRSKMVFIWQCPIMFMSYSACFFLLGLTTLVVTPLIRLSEYGWTGDATVAIIYLTTLTIVGAIFVFCAFWVYHYLDLEIDSGVRQELFTTPGQPEVKNDNDENGATSEAAGRIGDDSFPTAAVAYGTENYAVFNTDYSHSLTPRLEGFGH